MIINIKMIWALIILLPFFNSVAYAKIKSIYGEDNRHFVTELNSEDFKYSMPVGAMIAQSTISYSILDSIFFRPQTLNEGLNVCIDEKYSRMPYLSKCSGVLVAKNLVLTAGHCVKNMDDCHNYFWYFDYLNSSDLINSKNEIEIKNESVYHCKKIVEHMDVTNLNGTIDYTLIELDRKVLNIKPLELPRNILYKKSRNLMVIGHPLGMPKMYTDNFSVRKSNKKSSFIINSDTMSGNSGSAVIDMDSKKLVGILVSGEADFKFDFNENCNRNKICPDDACLGETVTSFTTFYNLLKDK